MLTVGVDLAAEPTGTAVACLDWSTTGASLSLLLGPADDDAVVAEIMRADKAGIDCPLGWPDEFVSFLLAHQAGTVVAPEDIAGRDWRRRLVYRHTDEAAATPLAWFPSVSPPTCSGSRPSGAPRCSRGWQRTDKWWTDAAMGLWWRYTQPHR